MRALIVAEKPSIVRAIVDLVSPGARKVCTRPGLQQTHGAQRNGRSQYNPVYDMQMTIQGSPFDVAITSVSGHMMNYEFEPPNDKW